MPKKNQIKKGALLWWKRTGNSSNQDINCPCVVKSVSEKHFLVISLDTCLEQTTILFASDTYKEEFRTTTKKKVLDYVKGELSRADKRFEVAKRELHEAYEDKHASTRALFALLDDFPNLLHE